MSAGIKSTDGQTVRGSLLLYCKRNLNVGKTHLHKNSVQSSPQKDSSSSSGQKRPKLPIPRRPPLSEGAPPIQTEVLRERSGVY